MGTKIGIVTFHSANNYGAVLQAYALQEYLAQCNIEPEIVDYRNAVFEKQYRSFSLESKNPKTILRTILNYPIVRKKEKVFAAFRRRYLKMGEAYGEDTIEKADDHYDAFVFGSDQVWNCRLTHNDPNYFGAFITDPGKLYSYAASFGDRHSDPSEYTDLLKRFRSVSVRESEGVRQFAALTGRSDAKAVADPVFLLERDAWERLALESTKKSGAGNYIFLYTLKGKTTSLMQAAQYLSAKTGLPIIEFQAWVSRKPKHVKPRYADGPTDFLRWIQNAKFVLTDSFHCTAFSIIFQKNFWVRTGVAEPGGRIESLLKELQVEGRVIPSELTKWHYEQIPVYEEIAPRLKEMADRSKAFIKEKIIGEPV